MMMKRNVMKKKSNFMLPHTKVFNEVAILLWTNSFRRVRRSPENNLYLSALPLKNDIYSYNI